jgi:hypothetical protein
VLCDLYAKDTGEGWEAGKGIGIFPHEVFLGAFECLPLEVVDWAGLDAYDPTVPVPDAPEGSVTLTMLNDDGESFLSIAKIIEEVL